MSEEDLRPEQVNIEQGSDQDVRGQLVIDQGQRAQLVNETPTAKRPAWLATETNHEKRIRLDAKNAKVADKRAAETDDERRSRLDAKNAWKAARVALNREALKVRADANNAEERATVALKKEALKVREAAKYKSRVALKIIGNETEEGREASEAVKVRLAAKLAARLASETDKAKRSRLDANNARVAAKKDARNAAETDDERRFRLDVNKTDKAKRSRLDANNARLAAKKDARNAAETDDDRRFRLDVNNGKQALKRKALDTTFINETDDEGGKDATTIGNEMDDERRSRLDAKRSRHATTIGNDSHDETKARLDAKNASLDLNLRSSGKSNQTSNIFVIEPVFYHNRLVSNQNKGNPDYMFSVQNFETDGAKVATRDISLCYRKKLIKEYHEYYPKNKEVDQDDLPFFTIVEEETGVANLNISLGSSLKLSIGSSDLSPGMLLGEYCGNLNTELTSYSNSETCISDCAFSLQQETGKNIFLDAKHHFSILKYASHSCTPNSVSRVVMDDFGHLLVIIIAEQTIKAGDNITINYGWTKASKSELEKGLVMYCLCGENNCGRLFTKSRSV
jgi:hypothetical protein